MQHAWEVWKDNIKKCIKETRCDKNILDSAGLGAGSFEHCNET
jgi:hypothetical protein